MIRKLQRKKPSRVVGIIPIQAQIRGGTGHDKRHPGLTGGDDGFGHANQVEGNAGEIDEDGAEERELNGLVDGGDVERG